MEATRLEITARKRTDTFGISGPADFETGQGQNVDTREVLANPCISLYCLDHEKRCALFVETAPDVDLSAAPFMYVSQFENALHVISMPYETFFELADSVKFDSSRLILVYSVGRSGSTLVSAALGAVPGVVGLSEPDAVTRLMAVRGWDGTNEAETSKLLDACIKLQCKATLKIPQPAAWVIKFRSYCIELADLLHGLFPHTRNIFLYRNAETQMISAGRAFIQPGVDAEDPGLRAFFQHFSTGVNREIAMYVRSGGPLLSMTEIGAMMWVRVMECYLDLVNQGMAMRYEDLKAAPYEAAQAIVSYCGFPDAPLDGVYLVLEKDSQAGTPLAQKALGASQWVTTAEQAWLEEILAAHAKLNPQIL